MSVHQTFIIPIIYFFKLLVYTFSFKISLSISQKKINQLNSGIPTRLNKFAWKDHQIHTKKKKGKSTDRRNKKNLEEETEEENIDKHRKRRNGGKF